MIGMCQQASCIMPMIFSTSAMPVLKCRAWRLLEHRLGWTGLISPGRQMKGSACLTCGDHVVTSKPVGACSEGAEVRMEPGHIKPAGQAFGADMMPMRQK